MRIKGKHLHWPSLVMIALCSQAPAQTLTGGWTIRVSNTVSPSQPIAEIEVWAWFEVLPPASYLFILGDFDFVSAEESLGRPQLAPGIVGQAGSVGASAVSDVLTGQLHIPNFVWGNLANPIHVWSVLWESTDFTPRSVSLETVNTTRFWIADWGTGTSIPVPPEGFFPGMGVIEVVPSPASATPLLVLGAVTLRRRRRDA